MRVSNATHAKSNGELIRDLLAGAWRASPPEQLEISAEELGRIEPLLTSSGAAALAWRLVRRSALQDSPAALRLKNAARLQALRTALHESELEKIFALLEGARIEALLVK